MASEKHRYSVAIYLLLSVTIFGCVYVTLHVLGEEKQSALQEKSADHSPATRDVYNSSAEKEQELATATELQIEPKTDASVTKESDSADIHQIVGIWEESGAPPGDTGTIEFRSDGTFAKRSAYGNLIVYNKKINMIDETTNPGHTYPASSTATGIWRIVMNPNYEEFRLDSNPLNPKTSPLSAVSLWTPSPEALILALDVGFRNPMYRVVTLEDDGRLLTLTRLVDSGANETYVKLR